MHASRMLLLSLLPVWQPVQVARAQLPAAVETPLVSPTLLIPADSLSDQSGYQRALSAVCGEYAAPSDAALLSAEQRLALAAGRSAATAADWHALGCTRALLDAANLIGREGLEMPLGAGWQEGSTNAWLRTLRLAPAFAPAAEGLGVLVLDQAFPRKGDAVRAALAGAVAAGAASPAAVRGCALLAARSGDATTARNCITRGLDAGSDSTWQLLLRARLDAVAHDTAAMARSFDLALRAAADSAAWAEVGWHLRWFTEPEEWLEWQALALGDRAAWVRDRLATRDVRDARSPSARLAAHFERLEFVEQHFRRDVPRRMRGRLAVAAAPEDTDAGRGRDADGMRFTSMPENFAARPFRFYRPWSPLLDDRGSVYLRFGAPSRRSQWQSTEPGNYNIREGWLYQLERQSLVVQFEGEYFDGSSEATRLVAGVLGNYLCELDAERCALVMRLSCHPPPPGIRCSYDDEYSPVSREAISVLEHDDEAMIAAATTRDDNAPQVATPISAVARLHRVWDPASGAVLAVVPYAFRLGDVARTSDSTGTTATLDLTLRQWDRRTETWLATAFTRRLRFAGRLDDNAHLTGYSVIPSATGVSAWSLYASQDTSRGGRSWGDGMATLSDRVPAMSDLIVGAASQGQVWTTTGGTTVPLGPLGGFDRNQPVSLYWQVRNGGTEQPARVTIALFQGAVAANERPVLDVAFDAPIRPGLNEFQRTLGVADLDAGRYRIEIVIQVGDLALSRSAPLLLH